MPTLNEIHDDVLNLIERFREYVTEHSSPFAMTDSEVEILECLNDILANFSDDVESEGER